MGANTNYRVFGYELVEKEITVSALTSTEALEVAQYEGLVKPYEAVPVNYYDETEDY